MFFEKCFVDMQKERTWVYKCIHAMYRVWRNYTTNNNESIKVHKETIVTVKLYKMSQHHTRQAFDYPNYSTYIYIYIVHNQLCVVSAQLDHYLSSNSLFETAAISARFFIPSRAIP